VISTMPMGTEADRAHECSIRLIRLFRYLIPADIEKFRALTCQIIICQPCPLDDDKGAVARWLDHGLMLMERLSDRVPTVEIGLNAVGCSFSQWELTQLNALTPDNRGCHCRDSKAFTCEALTASLMACISMIRIALSRMLSGYSFNVLSVVSIQIQPTMNGNIF
jgi:hypothetical protein